jgi:hypothetical protein
MSQKCTKGLYNLIKRITLLCTTKGNRLKRRKRSIDLRLRLPHLLLHPVHHLVLLVAVAHHHHPPQNLAVAVPLQNKGVAREVDQMKKGNKILRVWRVKSQEVEIEKINKNEKNLK